MTAQYVTAQQETRPPAAAKPVRWAADTVATMREGARVRLDYSAQSLWRVDRMIEEIRREGPPYAAVENVLRGFGAYAGEVIVRQTGAEWWATGGEYWVRTPAGRRSRDYGARLVPRAAPVAVPSADLLNTAVCVYPSPVLPLGRCIRRPSPPSSAAAPNARSARP